MIEQSFRETAARYAMLPAGCQVLCACSGGPDSTALLHLLCAVPDVTVLAAHFNHRLRGEEAERDEAFVRSLCDSLGVELVCGGADVAAWAAERRMGLEEAARTLRYEFLERTAADRGCDRIATAHHAEDNAETVLWNLIRGSGTRGLGGIPPVRGKLIRPLLNATRDEIEEYLSRNGLESVSDSSNALDDNPRNRIRHRVLPLLSAENGAAVSHICAASELLRADDAYLNSLAESFIRDCAQPDALPVTAFLALPAPVGARVLRMLCGPLQRKHVEAVYALCRGDSVHAEADLPGRKVRREYDVLKLAAAPEAALPPRELPPGETALPELGMTAIRTSGVPFDGIHNSFNTFYFKSASICGMISVASGSGGETVRFLGRGCTKSLRRLYQEAKLPLSERARTPVLYDEQGILAVYGFGIAERCAAAPGESAERIEFRKTGM